MAAQVKARIAGMRRDHPGWGPSRIRWELERAGVVPLPGRSAVYRALIRHGLVDPKKRKRRREDYRRWERSRAMDLWQMDVMGRAFLAGGLDFLCDLRAPFAREVVQLRLEPVIRLLGEPGDGVITGFGHEKLLEVDAGQEPAGPGPGPWG